MGTYLDILFLNILKLQNRNKIICEILNWNLKKIYRKKEKKQNHLRKKREIGKFVGSQDTRNSGIEEVSCR